MIYTTAELSGFSLLLCMLDNGGLHSDLRSCETHSTHADMEKTTVKCLLMSIHKLTYLSSCKEGR